MTVPVDFDTPIGKPEVGVLRFLLTMVGSLCIWTLIFYFGINSIDPEQTGMSLLLQKVAVGLLATVGYTVAGFTILNITSDLDTSRPNPNSNK